MSTIGFKFENFSFKNCKNKKNSFTPNITKIKPSLLFSLAWSTREESEYRRVN